MRTNLTAQQTSFFTKNGYIELEMAHEIPPFQMERDGWRKLPKWKEFLVRKLGPMVLTLSGKKQIRLALDQWFSEENRPKKGEPLKEILNIQGLIIAVAMCKNGVIPVHKSPLGILPVPKPGHLLFFRTDLILDWPHVKCDLYIAAYALSNAVYIHNPKDPSTNSLKHLGLSIGDVLKNDTHPLIF